MGVPPVRQAPARLGPGNPVTAVHRDLRGPADPVQQVGRPAQGVADPEQAVDQRHDPGQGPPLVTGPIGPDLGGAGPGPARRRAGRAGRRAACTPPREASAGLPPGVQARRQARIDFGFTRNRAAISPVGSCRSNIPAACNRTCSRAARPRAVRPPHRHTS